MSDFHKIAMEPLSVPPVLHDHYRARRFSSECVKTLHDFIDNTPSMLLRDPQDVKCVVKVTGRIAVYAPTNIDVPQLSRAHEYAHEAIHLLALADGFPHLHTHLYRDAADLAAKCYERTKQNTFAAEATHDYLCVVLRSSSAQTALNMSYVLGTLCRLGEFGLQWYVESGDASAIKNAARHLQRFPLNQIEEPLRLRAQNLLQQLTVALPR